MGLQDRDYMRRTHEPRPVGGSRARDGSGRVANWRTWILAATAIIALAGAAVWLSRDSTPREGSLIVNINTATQEQFETVPDIGHVLASRIIEGQPYESVDDLLRVPGIGEINLEGMRPFLKTEGETERK